MAEKKEKVAAEETVEKKTSTKKTAEKKPAEKKTSAKKTAEKKPAEKKTSTKKTAEKKPAEKKAPAKKTAEKKPVEKKAPAKKTAEKKPAEKKAPAKKAAEKKPAEKKAPAKKKTTKKADDLEKLVKELPGEEVVLDVNPEGDDKIPLDPETGLDPEKLETELNDLRDLVQDEIDKMMDENPDAEWNEIVKEAKDNKKNKVKKTYKLCECCEDAEVGDDEQYCSNCLNTMKHYPFVWWKFIFPIITVALVVFSFSYAAISFSVFKGTVDAQKLVKEGKLDSALTAYDNVNAEIKVSDENYGSRYLKYQVKLYDKIGIDSYEDLDEFLNKYYAGTKIDRLSNRYVKNIKAKVDSYSKLYEYFEDAMYATSSYEEFVTEFDKQIKGRGLNEAQAAYYKYYVATNYDVETETLLSLVDTIKAAEPTYDSLYLPLYCEIYLNDGDYDKVLTYANDLQKVNVENAYPYAYKAIAYRMKGDLTSATDAVTAGFEVDADNSLLNYQMAILSLLSGQNELAYSYASTAYQYADSVSTFVTSASIYSLTALLNEESDINDAILSEVSEYGYEISPDVEKIIAGEKTIEEVFTEGTGDFSWD